MAKLFPPAKVLGIGVKLSRLSALPGWIPLRDFCPDHVERKNH